MECGYPAMGYGYYLMTSKPTGARSYQRIDDGGLLKKGLMTRISISPDQTMICFGHIDGHTFKEPGLANPGVSL